MAKGTCSVLGCEKPIGVKRLRLCHMHYMRWYRTGEVGTAERQWNPPPPQCVFEDCERPARSRGLCLMHYKRQWKHGDPALGARPDPDAVGYLGVHHRLRNSRGDAARHLCQHCGKPAADWAYDYSDPNPRGDPRRGPYSLDLTRYIPLCRSCHKRFDLAAK